MEVKCHAQRQIQALAMESIFLHFDLTKPEDERTLESLMLEADRQKIGLKTFVDFPEYFQAKRKYAMSKERRQELTKRAVEI